MISSSDFISYGDPCADHVLIQPVDDHDLAGIENEIRLIREMTGREFSLIAVKVRDWNRDLSPWQAPAVFGHADFGGGARETLEEILHHIPEGKTCSIGGYSLAGLFALWAVCSSGRFSGAAAASPSLWFPGFSDYMKINPVCAAAVYLSLGDREEKTRNPVMAAVGDRIRELDLLLREKEVPHILEWNPGNHFRDADLRTAKAFAWLLNR